MSKAKTAKQIRAAADAVAQSLTANPAPASSDLLSTGSALLNIAISGDPSGAIPKGTYLYFVGDSGSGKSWFSLGLFAEAVRNPAFKKYSFVFDNAENGALMDVEKFFGAQVPKRMVPPCKDDSPGSRSLEEFYFNVERAVRRGPCIYVLDSMDSIQPESEEKNFEAKLHYHDTGKGKDAVKGSMGMAKAKVNANHISRIANTTLRSNGSILVVISQTRDLLNAQFPGMRTRSGGKALRFYAHVEAWTKVKGVIKKHHRGKDREIGAYVEVDVQKNRVSGWEGKLPLLSFIKGYGFDDVGSCVDYLLEERHWKPEKAQAIKKPYQGEEEEAKPKSFSAPEFEYTGDKEGLVRLIQESGQEPKLAQIAADLWKSIAAGAAPVRKPRY